jgi:iron-sulfur cluster insertion protein
LLGIPVRLRAIDYLEDLQGARFVINNPNATTTCGCGASFGI